jgi:hypothetical protein
MVNNNGNMEQIFCNRCDYEATVSGGNDIGMLAELPRYVATTVKNPGCGHYRRTMVGYGRRLDAHRLPLSSICNSPSGMAGRPKRMPQMQHHDGSEPQLNNRLRLKLELSSLSTISGGSG